MVRATDEQVMRRARADAVDPARRAHGAARPPEHRRFPAPALAGARAARGPHDDACSVPVLTLRVGRCCPVDGGRAVLAPPIAPGRARDVELRNDSGSGHFANARRPHQPARRLPLTWASATARSALLGLGELGRGAVGPHAHAVDRAAVGLAGLDARAQAEQGDPRLQRFGIAGAAERAGLQQIAGIACGGCARRGRRGGRRARRRRWRFGQRARAVGRGVAGEIRRVGIARLQGGLLLLGALLAFGFGAGAGGEFGVAHRDFLLGQHRVEIVVGRRGGRCLAGGARLRFGRRRGRVHVRFVQRAGLRLRIGIRPRTEETVLAVGLEQPRRGQHHDQRDDDADDHPRPAGEAAGTAAAAAGLRFTASCCHYIASGAWTPSRARPLASTWRTASASARRASRTSASSTRNWWSL